MIRLIHGPINATEADNFAHHGQISPQTDPFHKAAHSPAERQPKLEGETNRSSANFRLLACLYMDVHLRTWTVGTALLEDTARSEKNEWGVVPGFTTGC